MKGIKFFSGEEGFERVSRLLYFSEEEKKLRKQQLSESYMPFCVTEYYVNLIAQQKEPTRTQMINIILPPIEKKSFIGHFDPYGNHEYRKNDTHYLQHKYESTLLLHLNNHCFSNCQFCYKVNEIRLEKNLTEMISERTRKAAQYIKEHTDINNVLITGGDPAILANELLFKCIRELIHLDNIRIIRLATKGLSFYPQRFLDKEFLEFLYSINKLDGKQVCIVAQISHPGEFSSEMKQAISAIQETGTQIRAQPVFTNHINDNVDTLVELQKKIVDHKLLYYYIPIFMPVKGVEQYALPLEKIYRNIAMSKRKLSGLEKKSLLIVPHNFGKFELCGFLPDYNNPEKIILKWHQIVSNKYLPRKLREKVNTNCDDLLMLDYVQDKMYSIDDVFQYNMLPYYNLEGVLYDEQL